MMDMPVLGGALNEIEIEFWNTRNQRLQIGFAESHAAAIKHTVIAIEKTIGTIKKYLQQRNVTATKQSVSAHAVRRMSAKVSAERPPSCHANTAANRSNPETKSPAPTKRSQ